MTSCRYHPWFTLVEGTRCVPCITEDPSSLKIDIWLDEVGATHAFDNDCDGMCINVCPDCGHTCKCFVGDANDYQCLGLTGCKIYEDDEL